MENMHLIMEKKYHLIDLIKGVSDLYLEKGGDTVDTDSQWGLYIKKLNLYQMTLISVENNFNVYQKNMECYLLPLPKFDQDENVMIPPPFALKNNLMFISSGETVCDVIVSALLQKANATIDELVDALNYYAKNDAFIEYDKENSCWLYYENNY